MYRRLPNRLSSALLLFALAACGGGGGSVSPNPPPPPPPPPPPAPAPVATVTVTPNQASLVPQQTQALTAATLDAAGNTLTGRTVTWSTSAAAVATVSSNGLVTAVGGGNATVTATSEGKTGTATIGVADGGFVGQTGGTVNAANGAVKMTLPAGAVTGPLSVTVAPTTTLPTLPDGVFGVIGTGYTFGPAGTTFAQPVTVTVKYDPAKTPPWAIPSDFALYHYTGGAWVKLPNLTVDPVAHTISAQTTSFSPFTVGTRLPPAVLTPNPGSVNFIQRSVDLTASIPNHSGLGLTYAFLSTKVNGDVSQTLPTDPTARYTMTQPALPLGDLDQVQVIVRGAIDPANPTALVPLASAIAVVNGTLALSFEVNPQFGKTGFAQPTNLDAIARNPDGSVYTGKLKFVWSSTAVTGTLDVAGATPIPSARGVYTGFPPSQAPHINPRIDKVTVDFYVEEGTILNAGTWDQRASTVFNKKGSAFAFVEVAPKSYFGTFQVRTTPSPGGSCVAAVVLIPKVTGAASYAVQVTGIVGSSQGGSINKTVTGATNTGSILDVYDAGVNWGVPLEGGCNTTSAGITGRQQLYAGAYAHATILSTVP